MQSAGSKTLGRSGARHPLRREAWSVEGQQAWILAEVAAGPRSFVDLVGGRSRSFIIATFLAMLELARGQAVRLILGGESDDFRVAAAVPAAAV